MTWQDDNERTVRFFADQLAMHPSGPGAVEPGRPPAVLGGDLQLSQVPRETLVCLPCSWTPAEPLRLAIAALRCCPR